MFIYLHRAPPPTICCFRSLCSDYKVDFGAFQHDRLSVQPPSSLSGGYDCLWRSANLDVIMHTRSHEHNTMLLQTISMLILDKPQERRIALPFYRAKFAKNFCKIFLRG